MLLSKASYGGLAQRLLLENFAGSDDTLHIGGVSVKTLAETYGTPFFAYDAKGFRERISFLNEAIAGFAEIYYSIKANPNPEVVRVLLEAGAGLEIASAGEFEIARSVGADPSKIVFAGPAKGEAELKHTIDNGLGEVHLETDSEIERVSSIANELGRTVRVALRINPVSTVQGGAMRMGGKPAAFGFDEERMPEVVRSVLGHQKLDLTGIHIFAGTQILDANTLLAQWTHAIGLAEKVAGLTGQPVRTIDLGGGLGVPYHGGEPELDLAAVKAGIQSLREPIASHSLLRETKVILEPGRFLAAPCGIYVMSVRATKISRGERFIICDGGMHHHLAASGNLGQVIKRDYPIVAANRLRDGETHQATVVGPLCTPLDTLGRKTPMPTGVRDGDLIAVLQSGAYALSASPIEFLSHPRPAEILVDEGTHRCIATGDRKIN